MSAGAMLADIRRQPEALAALLARAIEIRACGARHLAPGPGGTIRSAGCGDGLFASIAASDAFAALGLPYAPDTALAAAIHGATRFVPADRMIAISMSGNVDRTAEAAERAAACGAAVVALCNGSGGRVARSAAARVSLELADIAPFLCGTSSYTATLAALFLLAEGAAGRRLGVALDEAASLVRAAIAAAETALAGVPLDGISGVRLLAAGVNLGSAAYGAAKLVELCRTPAWSADLEEFAHSQFWAMPARDLVVMISANAAFAAYAAASAEALAGMGVATLAIDTTAAPVPTATTRVTLPDAPEWLSPVTQAIPLQLLAHALARATGFDPDRRLHLKDDAARFATSRKLTRRALLGTGQ
jgi:glucosamine 6-phosphate synthetase-like amidotransferase/phosphosugar isomerase protein